MAFQDDDEPARGPAGEPDRRDERGQAPAWPGATPGRLPAGAPGADLGQPATGGYGGYGGEQHGWGRPGELPPGPPGGYAGGRSGAGGWGAQPDPGAQAAWRGSEPLHAREYGGPEGLPLPQDPPMRRGPVGAPPRGPWTAPGAHGGPEHPHDADYHRWREEQMRQLDQEYLAWRQERYRQFSDEFNRWRSSRALGAPAAGGEAGQDRPQAPPTDERG